MAMTSPKNVSQDNSNSKGATDLWNIFCESLISYCSIPFKITGSGKRILVFLLVLLNQFDSSSSFFILSYTKEEAFAAANAEL